MRSPHGGRLSQGLTMIEERTVKAPHEGVASEQAAAPGNAPVRPRVSVGIGVDLVEVAQVAAALDAFGERYLRRLFTPSEIDACRLAGGGYVIERLASRYAAKEAALKMLEPGPDEVPEWHEIEVRSLPSGASEIALAGAAAELAARRGIHSAAMSTSHEGGFATAVVIGWGESACRCQSVGLENA